VILLWVEHVPNGVEGIHFEFVVLVTPCIDIEEHLEVVVVVDHRVTLSDRRPDILLLQARDEIDRLIVPQHRGARQTPGRRRIGRLMILKIDRSMTPPATQIYRGCHRSQTTRSRK
jgi:hypothetical protein